MLFYYDERYTIDLKFLKIESIITSYNKRPSKYLKKLYFSDDKHNIFCWCTTKLNHKFICNTIYKIKFTISSFDENRNIFFIQRPLFISK